MPYFVCWTPASDRRDAALPQAFATISQALDRACELIRQHRPADIRVVDETGSRAAADFQIRAYLRHRRRAPPG